MAAKEIVRICLTYVGTLFNLWFILAILTSRDMRSRLRNKIICSTLAAHLLNNAFTLASDVADLASNFQVGCDFHTVFSNLQLMQDFIVNWLVVMLLIVFIAQITDINPSTKLTPRAITIGTFGLILLPWITSVIVVPIIVHQKKISWLCGYHDCLYRSLESMHVIKSTITIIPIILGILLLIIAAFLRFERVNSRHSSGSTQAQLPLPGPEIDNIFAYLNIVVTCVFCDLPATIISILYGFLEIEDRTSAILSWAIIVFIFVEFLTDIRSILMTLSWFYLPDVEQRVKGVWRHCKRSTPGKELIVTYTTLTKHRQDSDESNKDQSTVLHEKYFLQAEVAPGSDGVQQLKPGVKYKICAVKEMEDSREK